MMWPMMLMCAPVALLRACFVSVPRFRLSQASRMTADRMLPAHVANDVRELPFSDQEPFIRDAWVFRDVAFDGCIPHRVNQPLARQPLQTVVSLGRVTSLCALWP